MQTSDHNKQSQKSYYKLEENNTKTKKSYYKLGENYI